MLAVLDSLDSTLTVTTDQPAWRVALFWLPWRGHIAALGRRPWQDATLRLLYQRTCQAADKVLGEYLEATMPDREPLGETRRW